MKNNLLTLSCALLIIAKIGAAQSSEHGGVMTQSPQSHPHRLHEMPIHPHDIRSASKNENREMTSTDPYELAEKSDELFGQGRFKEAARFFIDSAIYGNYDNKASLVEIDPLSLKYLNSNGHQSAEAESYYENTLTPKLIKYFGTQFSELQKHKDTPVKVYGIQ